MGVGRVCVCGGGGGGQLVWNLANLAHEARSWHPVCQSPNLRTKQLGPKTAEHQISSQLSSLWCTYVTRTTHDRLT